MSLLDTASLIVTPNGYKEGKLYSVIPSDGSGDMSVTRATTATRVNSAGLVELVPYNLIWCSEQFDNLSYWGLEQISVTANSTTAPNGTLTADTITDSSTFGYTYQSVPLSGGVGSIVTHSVFLKRTNNDWVNVAASRTPGTTYGEFGAWFNLATGAIGSNFQSGAGIVVDKQITDEGDGWYRCSVTGYVPNAVGYVPYVFNSNADNSFTSSAGKSHYQWGAQLVEGTLKDYQKTETRLNIPRLDYSNGTCPSLLVEPQRTNVLTYSSSFSSAGWLNTNSTITSNTTASPSGVQDADTIAFGSGGYVGQFFTHSGVHSFSIYAKYIGTQWLYLQNYNGGDFGAWFDIQNGTIGTIESGVTASIEQAENGFYRCTITYNASNSNASYYVFFNTTGNGSFARTGSSYFWGAQLELGSYSTSYIPTTSASVTRNADVISKTGISSLIGQTEGTIFWDINVDILSASGHEDIFNIDNGAFGNTIYLIKNANATFAAEVYNASSVQCSFINIPISAVGKYKLALAYKTNDFAFYVNGVLVGSDTSGSVGAMSRIQLGQTVFGPSTGYTNAAALWKTRLTNTQLAQLTTI